MPNFSRNLQKTVPNPWGNPQHGPQPVQTGPGLLDSSNKSSGPTLQSKVLKLVHFWPFIAKGPRTSGPKSAGNTIGLKIQKFTFFAWAISLSWNFWSSFKTLDCRVGPLDSFEGSSSPGPTLAGQGPFWGLPQRFGTIFLRFLTKLGIVGLSILTFGHWRSQDPWTKVRWEYN